VIRRRALSGRAGERSPRAAAASEGDGAAAGEHAHATRSRRWLRGALKVAVSAAGIGLLLREVDERVLAATLAAADPALIALAIGVYLAGQVITAWRWQIIARAAGFAEPLGRVVVWYFIGMFFNLFGPSTLGGDLVRSLYLAEPSGRRAVALHTVIFDRLSGLAMLFVLAFAAFAAFGSFRLPPALFYTTVGLGTALVAGWWAVPPVARRVLPAHNRVRRMIEAELRLFWRDPALLLTTSAVSLGFHVVQVATAAIAGAAVGLAVPWPSYFVFHPLVTIFSALPVSVAGVGLREFGYVWFLSSLLAVPEERAAAFAVVWLAVLIASSLAGGAVFLATGARMPRLRRRRASAASRHAGAARGGADA
jgi:uncharacterized membrane protein YbhN (UPF0104 family)